MMRTLDFAMRLAEDLKSAALNQGAALVGWKRSATGATARTAADKLGEHWSLEDFGAKGDGVTDCLPAFNAAIAAMSPPASGQGNFLCIPAGVYRFSGPLHVSRNMVLEGAGGAGWSAATTLKLDAGQHGIIVDRQSTSPDGGGGDWSVLRNLAVHAAGKTAAAHGIHLKARAALEHVYVTGFKGNGLHIEADVSSGTNANLWYVADCRVDACDGHGCYVNGGDVNAGLALRLDCSDNGGWGIYDSSFLGNTYVACHVAANGQGAYKTDDVAAKNVLLGCYSEGFQGPSDLAPRTLVIGGEHGAGFVPGCLAPVLSGTDRREFQVEHGITAWNPTGSVGVRASLGKSDDTNTALEFFTTDVNNHHRLRYNFSAPGWWDLLYGNLGDKIVISFSTAAAPEGSGVLQFPSGFRLGGGAVARSRSMVLAQPSPDEGGPGDIAWNYLPGMGQPVGWIKTADAPNVWVPLLMVGGAAAAGRLTASQVWDPPSLADGAAATVDLFIGGAALGDFATCAFSNPLPARVYWAQPAVVAANLVRCTLINASGSLQDLGSGVVSVLVWK